MVTMKSKTLTLLLSLVIALGLWMYVVTVISPEQEASYHGVPVVLENEGVLQDRELMLLPGGNSTVSVRLHGNRADLNELNSSNMTASVDLSGIYEPGVYDCDYKINVPSGVSSVTVAKRLTEKVHIEVVKYASKQVPVQLVFSGELKQGLFVDQEGAILSDRTVTVEGPADQVNQIRLAGIEINRGDLDQTVAADYRITLMNDAYKPVDVSNVGVDVSQVHVVLPVEYMKEIPLTVELIDGGGATGEENAVVVMSPADTITITGSREALDKITELTITTVNLADVDLKEGYTEKVPIKLPDNLTNQSGITEIEVMVTLKGMETKTLTLSRDQITVVNLPEGLKAEIITQKIDVKFRGPTDQVRPLRLEQITATVDLTDCEAGGYTLQLNIEVKDASRVGAYGSYKISVNLTPPDAGPDGTQVAE